MLRSCNFRQIKCFWQGKRDITLSENHSWGDFEDTLKEK
jgi:hypothetical protein